MLKIVDLNLSLDKENIIQQLYSQNAIEDLDTIELASLIQELINSYSVVKLTVAVDVNRDINSSNSELISLNDFIIKRSILDE